MTPEYFEKIVASVKPDLVAQLLSSFRSLADVDGDTDKKQEKLDAAIRTKDERQIRERLGISEDGLSWPRLDDALTFVFDQTFPPVFDYVRHDVYKELAENADDFPKDEADFRQALNDAKGTIIRDSLEGIATAITLILAAPAAYELGAVHLIAALGMTRKQATLFIAANRVAIRLYKRLGGQTDPDVRAAIVENVLTGIPALIAAAIRRIMRERKVIATFTLDDSQLFSKRMAQGFQEFRSNALATDTTSIIAHATQLSVWKQAKALGIIGTDAVKFWRTVGDERVRHSHELIEAMNPDGVGLDAPFKNTLGIELFYPPAELNCRCSVVLGNSSQIKSPRVVAALPVGIAA